NFTNEETVTFQQANGENYNFISSFDETRLRRFNTLFGSDFVPNRYGIVNNYDLEERIYAGFVMLKIKVGQKFTVIPGFRMERSDNVYRAAYSDLVGDFGEDGFIRDTSATVDYTIPMPHLHLKYEPVEWLDFRASYSTTLARPDYEYIVPATAVSRGGDIEVKQGNPGLEASVSRNYDVFITAYSNKWGLFSGGVFYKDIADAFYPQVIGLNTDSIAALYGFAPRDVTGGILTTYQNSPESYVRGFEVELQSNLNFLPGFLKGFVLNVNYTRLTSETTINAFRRELIIQPPIVRRLVIPFQRKAALIGQARDIFNISLGYDYKRSLSMRASASYQGDKLASYSDQVNKDRFNRGFWRFDAALKYKFQNGLHLFLNLNNLTDQKDINYFTSLDRALNEAEFVTSVNRFGATATFGVQYKLDANR
ncbi:MAG: TonB-dependent receptor, partial [Bacteroidetes bacterium]